MCTDKFTHQISLIQNSSDELQMCLWIEQPESSTLLLHRKNGVFATGKYLPSLIMNTDGKCRSN